MRKIIIIIAILLCTSCLNKNLNDYNLYKNQISSSFNNEWKEIKKDNNKYTYEKYNNASNTITIQLENNSYNQNDHIKYRNEIYNELINYASQNDLIINGNSYKTPKNNIIYQFNLKNDTIQLKYYYIIGNYKSIKIVASIKDQTEQDEIDIIISKIVNNFEWK